MDELPTFALMRLLLMSTDNAAPESVTPGRAESTSTPLAPPTDPRTLLRCLQDVSPAFRDCLPLALRIDKTIMERFPDWNRKLVRSALRQHTASTRYLKAVEKGSARFDFEGNEAGELTDEHRQHAAQTLKERFAEQARRRREQAREQNAQQRAQEQEQRRADKLQALVGKFSSRKP